MKLGQLYSLESYNQFKDSYKAFTDTLLADSYNGIVLERNFTKVNPNILTKKYPELTFVNSGVQADNSGGYAKRIQTLKKLGIGSFKNAGDRGDDKGHISLTSEDTYMHVLERMAQSEWSDTDIKEAQLQGINLISDYLTTHNEVYLREVDKAGLIGVPDNAASEGILNYSQYATSVASSAIKDMSPQQMFDEIAALITDQWNSVNNITEYMADAVTMPIHVFNKISKTMLDTSAGTSTVLKALQDNFAGIKLNSSFRANDIGGGVSSTAAYSTSKDSIVMRLPIPLTIGTVTQRSSFTFHVESKYRVAGVDFLENASGRILKGL